MLSRLRHHLVFLLFIALPFHALFVTLGTKLIEGPGHPPHSLLALWKEVLMALIFIIAILELFQSDRKIITGIICGERWKWRISVEKGCILVLLLLAILTQLFTLHSSLFTSSFVYGFKYLFVPLIFFAVLASLPWEENFLEKKLFPALLFVGGIVSLYGIITFFLPQSFFTFLGYSDAHSLYAAGSPLSAFQQISGTAIRRIQSTFSGPNQFGLWLLVPWSIGVVKLLKRFSSSERSGTKRVEKLLDSSPLRGSLLEENILLLIIGIALLMTFSRSAWIAAFVITLLGVGMHFRGMQRRRIFVGLLSVVILATAVLMIAKPELLLRSISNRHHLERVQAGIAAMVKQPLGYGLGFAGPASNRVSDACIFFEEEGADISWAKDRMDLCIFVGNTQVQPTPEQKMCRCPFVPENWYVQVGIELGVLGFAIFLALTLVILVHLKAINAFPVFLSFLGVSIAALFLHAWEDSAVAYTVWGLAGIVLSFSTRFARSKRT